MLHLYLKRHYKFLLLFLFFLVTLYLSLSVLGQKVIFWKRASPPNNYSGRVGTYFFHWYRCPDQVVTDPQSPGANACDPTKMLFRGVGMVKSLPAGGYYHWTNLNWYKREFQDMAYVGITDAYPVDFYDSNQVQLMTQAIDQLGLSLKIGFFWDPPSESSNFDLSNPVDRDRLYSNYVKPYFLALPSRLWSLKNGRPVIFTVYIEPGMKNLGYSGQLFLDIKTKFSQDFGGVIPFLVIESGWFNTPAPPTGFPTINSVADARYTWGGAVSRKVDLFNGVKITSLGPGIDMRHTPWGGQTSPYIDRSAGNYFQQQLAGVPTDSDFLMIETWNELFENTGISRAVDYLDQNNKPMVDIAYMEILQQYLNKPAIPRQTTPPSAPTDLSINCEATTCNFSWSSLEATYADNIRYLYKIFSSTREGTETLCPEYTFSNSQNIYHGGGCWRGNNSDTIDKSVITGPASYTTACPDGVCTLSVWAKDGSNNYSQVASKTFSVNGNLPFSFSFRLQGILVNNITKAFEIDFRSATTNKTFSFTTISGTNGVFSVSSLALTGLTLGSYTVYIKDISSGSYRGNHLRKNMGNVTLVEGSNTAPSTWSTDSQYFLKPGDVIRDGVENNVVNITDIAAELSAYTALSVPVNDLNRVFDINGDERISVEDISLVLGTYMALSVPGD